MVWPLVFVCLLAPCTCAFAPAPIRMGERPVKNSAHAPVAFLNEALASQDWTMLDRPSMPQSATPHFLLKADKISWMDWCLEASNQVGSAVRINRCTDGPTQKWNWVLGSDGQGMIQLKDTNKCISFTRGISNGGHVVLRECGEQVQMSLVYDKPHPFLRSPLSWSSIPNGSTPLISMFALGVLVVGAWLVRWQTNVSARTMRLERPPIIEDGGGVSLIVQESGTAQATVPAILAINPIHGNQFRPCRRKESVVNMKDGSEPIDEGTLIHESLVGAQPSVGTAEVSRRNALGCGLLVALASYDSRTPGPVQAFEVEKVKPKFKDTYAEVQPGSGPLRILEIGSGTKGESVFEDRFRAGTEVVCLDLRVPDGATSRDAKKYAAAHGYKVSFVRGDATNMKNIESNSFDAVVDSLLLCSVSSAEAVVSEVRRVLKPGGRYGFVEHIDDIDKVIVDKVFGDPSVLRFQRYPEKTNLVAGVVVKPLEESL